MKKRLFKTATICILMVVAMLALTSCGSKTKTVSEYLHSKEKIAAPYIEFCEGGIGKETLTNGVLVFEGDKVTYYDWILLWMEEVASMSNEELIDYCEENAESSDIYSFDSYRLVCYTDSTGNNVYAEGIQVKDKNGEYDYINNTDLFYVGSNYKVYNSEFTALVMPYAFGTDATIALKDAPTIILDDTNSDGVIIDP